MKYFFLAERVVKGIAFAFTEDEDALGHELAPLLRGRREVPFDMWLKRVKHNSKETKIDDKISGLVNKWVDYQSNNLAWPLMSGKMRSIIEKNLSGLEEINWLQITIHADGEKRIYYIPQFTKMLDVLDEDKTVFVEGTDHVVIPCFASGKIFRFGMFTLPGRFSDITSGLYVSVKVKNELVAEKITGITFENIKISER